MPKNLTLNDVAALIADAEGAPSKLVPTMLRRVRSFDAKDLLPTEREETGRREGRLSMEGACLAYIYSELTDLGFDAALLRELRRTLDKPAELDARGPTRLAATIASIQANRDMELRIELLHRKSPYQKAYHFGVRDIGKPDSRVRIALDARDAERGVAARTTTNVNLTMLLSDFIASFDAAEG